MRFVVSVLVVLIHSPLPGIAGTLTEALARIAVPFFFMISGYYVSGNDKKEIIRKIKKTAEMFIWAVFMYFAWEMLWSVYHGTTAEKLKLYFSIQTLVETVVLNTGSLLGHLWFLLALLYCYGIYALFLQKATLSVRKGVVVVLLSGFFLIRELLKQNGVSDPVYYLRNFLFVGLPFFLLGEIVMQRKMMFLNTKTTLWIVVAAIGLGIAVVERIYIGCCDLYLGTVLAVVAMFILVQKPTALANDRIANLGRQCAGDIYIFHVLIIGGLNMIASVAGILKTNLFLIARPIVVTCLSILLSKIKHFGKRKHTR